MTTINIKEVGERLKIARLDNKLTQVELAKKVDSLHAVINSYERGRRGKRPDINLIVKISRVLGISLDWIFTGRKKNLS